MIDTTTPITKFIKENFSPSVPELAKYKYSSVEFLEVLFSTFPKDSIDTYDLYNILVGLGYTPQKEADGDGITTIWCFD